MIEFNIDSETFIRLVNRKNKLWYKTEKIKVIEDRDKTISSISSELNWLYKNCEDSIYGILVNSKTNCFFRDNIVAKSDKVNSFNIIDAVKEVNIKYPLKYFKNHKIIDTPGLASFISATDKVVKENLYGKSHIFWFLDASNKTMSDSLTLLAEEKELLKNIGRIHFIANRFDMMGYDEDNNSQNEVLKTVQELKCLLTTTLNNILEAKNINPKMNFTSFKYPRKKFYDLNTEEVIKSIEESLLLEKKESNYKNITSLILTMKVVLVKIKENVILNKRNVIETQLKAQENEKGNLLNEMEKLDKKRLETLDMIKKAKKNIKDIKKGKRLNNRDKCNEYVEEFRTEVRNSCKKIKNSVTRMEDLGSTKFDKKLNQIERIKTLSLKEEKVYRKKLWNKVRDKFPGSELKKKKEEVEKYVSKKLYEFTSLADILNEAVEKYKVVDIRKNEKTIDNLIVEKDNIKITQIPSLRLDKRLRI
ncbi:MAG: hypothetical protein GY932_08275 [Arcobacter sp.]|nr:hypothetical protein [Arcobacter sp.]